MPRIKPFCALMPTQALQERVVTKPLENYSLGQARLIASENKINFLHLIDPELDNPYLRGSRQELVYKKINENLEYFMDEQVLVRDQEPAIYIYQVVTVELTQNGIWTLTHINDYLSGDIKKHELTVERREKLLAEYLQQTALDANPVLITYTPVMEIDLLIAQYQNSKADVDFTFADGTIHRLWKVTASNDLNTLVQAFGKIKTVYIADGHHRIASMAKMALNKRKLLGVHDDAKHNYFSTAYFSTNEVCVLEFNRMVRDLAGLTEAEFLKALEKSFTIEKCNEPIKPNAIHHFGMYLKGTWYLLIAKPHTYAENNPIALLDVSILQDYVLNPILKIIDPRTDARIAFEGGKIPIDVLQDNVDHQNYEVAFTLYPTSVKQLMDVADVDGVMPPKSTWVEPKFLVGLITNDLNG